MFGERKTVEEGSRGVQKDERVEVHGRRDVERAIKIRRRAKVNQRRVDAHQSVRVVSRTRKCGASGKSETRRSGDEIERHRRRVDCESARVERDGKHARFGVGRKRTIGD